jgi:eukaryotic-like serine/threonine-protein kinase
MSSNSGSLDALVEQFERLLGLDAAQREAALAALPDEEAKRLRALLAADAGTEAPIADCIARSAARLQGVEGDATVGGQARLGPWRLLREIGAGGMGTVFLAERADGAFEQRAAIKLLRGFPTAEGLRRLRQERQILAGLNHPNIARLLDGGETEDGQPYLVMEYVDGRPLGDWLATEAPDRTRRLQVFGQLLDAVAHAHQCLVIHRDLKPGNVLVRVDGSAKLLDFGVARLGELGASEGETTRVFSPGWASPEQQVGGAITTASDVYSLGVLLRVLLGGCNDNTAAREPALADAELRRIIDMATARERSARYPTVEALHDDLERWRSGRPLRAAADSRSYRLRKFLSRHRFACAAVMLAVLATAAFTWRLVQERDRALLAERLAQENAARSDAQQRFLSGFLLGAGGKDATGQPISGLAMLEQASARLEQELAAEPAAHAGIAEQLAQAYMNALEFGRAVEFARVAIERSLADERAEVMATRWRLLARNLASLDQVAEAEAACRSGLSLLPDPPRSLEQARAATQLKVTLARVLSEPAALKAAREDVIAYARRHLPSGDPLRGPAAMMWAAQLELEERYAELLPARREALEQWQQDPAAFPTDLALQQLHLARALRLNGELVEAEHAARTGWQRIEVAMQGRAFFGREMARAELAEVLLAQGRVAEARAEFEASRAAPAAAPRFEAVWLEARLLRAEDDHEGARQLAAQARALIRFEAQQRWLDAFETELASGR